MSTDGHPHFIEAYVILLIQPDRQANKEMSERTEGEEELRERLGPNGKSVRTQSPDFPRVHTGHHASLGFYSLSKRFVWQVWGGLGEGDAYPAVRCPGADSPGPLLAQRGAAFSLPPGETQLPVTENMSQVSITQPRLSFASLPYPHSLD